MQTIWSSKSKNSILKPHELSNVKQLKFVKNEIKLLEWLENFSSLKNIINSVKLKWIYDDSVVVETNKQSLIKNFCLKLGENESIFEVDKKRIFKIIQFLSLIHI